MYEVESKGSYFVNTFSKERSKRLCSQGMKEQMNLEFFSNLKILLRVSFTHVAVQFCPHNRTYVACHMRNTVAVLASGPRVSSLTKATLQHHQRADIREVKHDVTFTANGKHETFVVCLQLCTVE